MKLPWRSSQVHSGTLLKQLLMGNRAQRKTKAFMEIKTRVTQATVMASGKLRAERSSFGGDVRKCSLQTGTLDASRNASAIERRLCSGKLVFQNSYLLTLWGNFEIVLITSRFSPFLVHSQSHPRLD